MAEALPAKQAAVSLAQRVIRAFIGGESFWHLLGKAMCLEADFNVKREMRESFGGTWKDACFMAAGCGFRNCLELRVQCFNLDAMLFTVHDGKRTEGPHGPAAGTRFARNSRTVGCRWPTASRGLGLQLYRCVSSPATEMKGRREGIHLAVVSRQRD